MNPPLSFRQTAQMMKPKEFISFTKEANAPAQSGKGLYWILPFYKQAPHLVEITNEDRIPATRTYYISTRESDAPIPMGFAHGFIEQLNIRFEWVLERDTLDEYIRFYMGFTRGTGGRVLPVESVDELPLREELTVITRRHLQNAITPLAVQGDRSAVGCFLIADKLFQARAVVDANGSVTLEPLALLAETLPVYDALLEG